MGVNAEAIFNAINVAQKIDACHKVSRVQGRTLGTMNTCIHNVIHLTALTDFSVADYMKNLSYLFSLTIYIYKFYRHYFPNYYPILTHPVNFPCGRKPENEEKTHDFWQS